MEVVKIKTQKRKKKSEPSISERLDLDRLSQYLDDFQLNEFREILAKYSIPFNEFNSRDLEGLKSLKEKVVTRKTHKRSLSHKEKTQKNSSNLQPQKLNQFLKSKSEEIQKAKSNSTTNAQGKTQKKVRFSKQNQIVEECLNNTPKNKRNTLDYLIYRRQPNQEIRKEPELSRRYDTGQTTKEIFVPSYHDYNPEPKREPRNEVRNESRNESKSELGYDSPSRDDLNSYLESELNSRNNSRNNHFDQNSMEKEFALPSYQPSSNFNPSKNYSRSNTRQSSHSRNNRNLDHDSYSQETRLVNYRKPRKQSRNHQIIQKRKTYEEELAELINVIETKTNAYRYHQERVLPDDPRLLKLRLSIISDKKRLKEMLPQKEAPKSKSQSKSFRVEKKSESSMFKIDHKAMDKEYKEYYQRWKRQQQQYQDYVNGFQKSEPKPDSKPDSKPEKFKKQRKKENKLGFNYPIKRSEEIKHTHVPVSNPKPKEEIKNIYLDEDEGVPYLVPPEQIIKDSNHDPSLEATMVIEDMETFVEPRKVQINENDNAIVQIPREDKQEHIDNSVLKLELEPELKPQTKFDSEYDSDSLSSSDSEDDLEDDPIEDGIPEEQLEASRRSKKTLKNHKKYHSGSGGVRGTISKDNQNGQWESIPFQSGVNGSPHVKPVKLTQKRIKDFLVKEKITGENKEIPKDLMEFLYSTITESGYKVNFIDLLVDLDESE